MIKSLNRRNKEEPKIINWMSLSWDPSEHRVSFSAMFELMKIYDLKVVDMTFFSNNPMLNNRNLINFAIEGTYRNLESFSNAVPLSKDMDQFEEKE